MSLISATALSPLLLPQLAGMKLVGAVSIPLPVPSLYEQEKIVEKIEDLLRSCDAIEQLISSRNLVNTKFALSIVSGSN